jgi:hypothetical protein
MNQSTPRIFQPRVLAMLLSLLGMGAALALPLSSQGLAEAQARYRQEMEVCNSGHSNQDLATCQREARNALAEYKRGLLGNGNARFSDNARRRCEALSGDERRDCLSRMRGEGIQEGSVAGGGILRETITTVIPGADKRP